MKKHTNFSSPRQRALTIATALQGRRVGYGWMACCPAHEDRTPSLSICDGEDKVLVHCHAGCEQDQVIAALRSRGLWEQTGEPRRRRSVLRPVRDDARRSEIALAIWQSSMPAAGTPVETYLASRRLHLLPPPTLQFHPGLKHTQGSIWPVMVALVTRGYDDKPLAIHRTFLNRVGSGKAPVAPQKMMLGPCYGGAVRLAAPSNTLMIGEGIETCLSVMQATGHPAWAALSTSGLRSLDLPAEVRDVTVLADGDDPGEEAARDAAQRWKREGRRVRIARSPRGTDFNDILMDRPAVQEGAP